ncbi:hypothetical protein [Nesterenkonia pannonica]|uniref:hypothetical protein n=1 Tax=Nesterenkonia pannonica TaxID=1548602 RepID=UPI002164BD60|nr:hypothetical protein [Nesterenkonia pannonica]
MSWLGRAKGPRMATPGTPYLSRSRWTFSRRLRFFSGTASGSSRLSAAVRRPWVMYTRAATAIALPRTAETSAAHQGIPAMIPKKGPV